MRDILNFPPPCSCHLFFPPGMASWPCKSAVYKAQHLPAADRTRPVGGAEASARTIHGAHSAALRPGFIQPCGAPSAFLSPSGGHHICQQWSCYSSLSLRGAYAWS